MNTFDNEENDKDEVIISVEMFVSNDGSSLSSQVHTYNYVNVADIRTFYLQDITLQGESVDSATGDTVTAFGRVEFELVHPQLQVCGQGEEERGGGHQCFNGRDWEYSALVSWEHTSTTLMH